MNSPLYTIPTLIAALSRPQLAVKCLPKWAAMGYFFYYDVVRTITMFDFDVHVFRCRYIQDWGLGTGRETLGRAEEPTCDELWQAVPINTTILQEGHHPEDVQLEETRLSVLPGLHDVTLQWHHRDVTKPRMYPPGDGIRHGFALHHMMNRMNLCFYFCICCYSRTDLYWFVSLVGLYTYEC